MYESNNMLEYGFINNKKLYKDHSGLLYSGHENGHCDSFGKEKVAAEESKQGLYGNVTDFTAVVAEW